MAALTLHLEIVGLCLLAMEEDQMHLLLPSTSPPCFAHDLLHRAVLGISDRENPASGDYTEFPLDAVDLDFSGIGGSRFEKPSLEEVANLSVLTRERLDPQLLTDPHPKCVRSRVRIASGRSIPVPAEAEWLIPGHGSPVPLAHRLKWIIHDVLAEELRESLKELRSESHSREMFDAPSIHLRIRHVPYDETPRRDLVPNESAGHFAAYYGLFPGGREPIVPIFYRRRTNIRTDFEKQGAKHPYGMIFTCMLA